MKSGKVYYRDTFAGTLTKDVDACFGIGMEGRRCLSDNTGVSS